MLKTSDKKTHKIKKWSNLKLLDDVDISEEIPLPFDSNSLVNVLNQCQEEERRMLRVYNEFTQVTETKVELLRLIKTADQLGAENIVLLNCLKLSQVIRSESLAMIAT